MLKITGIGPKPVDQVPLRDQFSNASTA